MIEKEVGRGLVKRGLISVFVTSPVESTHLDLPGDSE